MTGRTRYGITLAFLLAVFGALLLALMVRRQNATVKFVQTFQIMGTVARHTFYGPDAKVRAADKAARAAMERISAECNLYDSESELCRLNRNAADAPFVCSPGLWAILCEARKAWSFSGGAFDVSAKPLMDLWGFYRKREKLPSIREITDARALVGLGSVLFDDTARSVRFPRPGMALDLGGIAKGFAADRAAEAAVACGVRSGVIDLGGNLRMLPEPPPGKTSYQVGLRNPSDKNKVLDRSVEVGGEALSTSGNYERFVVLNGRKLGHIVDPVTGLPTSSKGAVTVIAPSACQADWLSTAIFLRGQPLAARAGAELSGVKVIFIP